MNRLENGSLAIGAPGSPVRQQADIRDALRGLLYAVEAQMDDLKFHVQTGRFRPSDSTVRKLITLRNAFNNAKHIMESNLIGA